MTASHALSQLSYSPTQIAGIERQAKAPLLTPSM